MEPGRRPGRCHRAVGGATAALGRSQHQAHLTSTQRRPVLSLLLWGGHRGTGVSGASGQPSRGRRRGTAGTPAERPGRGTTPAGTCWPGRPRGREPAPGSWPGSCPGPGAAPGCFWVWAPLRCLQEEGVLAVSPGQSPPGPCPQGPSRQGPHPRRAGMRLGRARAGAPIPPGLGWVPRRGGREAVSREWKVWPPDAPRSCCTSTRCAM